MISLSLPFVDWYLHGQQSLQQGQIITWMLLNGYVVFRFYQNTLSTAAQTQTVLKESVEHLRFIWTVRTVKIARQLFFEINEVYETLVNEWGEAYAREVLDVSIYITDRDRREAAAFRNEIRESLLFRSRRVFFIRPKLPQMLEHHLEGLFRSRPAYSSTLLAFCGGPQLSAILREAVAEARLLSVATAHASHRLEYVSESYGAAKSGKTFRFLPVRSNNNNNTTADRKKDANVSKLWDAVKEEAVRIVNAKRVKAAFEYENESKKEEASEQHCFRRSSMMKSEYQRSGMILRNRSGRHRGSSPQSNPFARY